MKNFEELEQIIIDAKNDAHKFYTKGNAAAGKRLRQSMQHIKVKAQEIRTEVSEIKNKN